MHLKIAPQFRFLNKTSLIVISLMTAASFIALAVSARGWLAPAKAIGSKMISAMPEQKPTPEPIRVEPITLTTWGFYPREFKRQKGRFILVVNNRSGVEKINLTLSRENSDKSREKQKDAEVLHKQPDWNDEFDLSPGEYVLSEARHPKWECRITVKPN